MITVFGSINLDLVVVVPRLPGAGETVSGPDHQTFAGGKGANQAMAARRAGAVVRMIGAVGKDAFADLALQNLRAASVDLAGVRALEGATGLALIGVDHAGENQIIVASGANARVDADWLGRQLAAGDTLMLQGESPFAVNLKAIERASLAGAAIVWNPAPVPQGDLGGALEHVATLIVNETEAVEISGRLGVPGDPEGFAEALVTPARNVVVTLGGRGVVAANGDGKVILSPPRVDVVDTTGAGDAFCGALAAALDLGETFQRAVREGVAAGALACTVTGAQTSAPDKQDIARLADQIA